MTPSEDEVLKTLILPLPLMVWIGRPRIAHTEELDVPAASNATPSR